uniref:Uncharacterized protein n=1 Tax=viral metagenome TaxID=1070528 RepID=A0A6H1ZAF0_9ZZZZ
MPRVPDIAVFVIYFLLAATSLWQAGCFAVLWGRAGGRTKRFMLCLIAYAVTWAVDDVFWLFVSKAYVHVPIPSIAEWLIVNNAWVLTKGAVLIASVATLIFWYLPVNKSKRSLK